MISQESSLRGYALTGDNTFLQPYQAGRAQLANAELAISSDPPPGLASLVTSEEKAASVWQQSAQTRATMVSAQGPGGGPSDSVGGRLFQNFRSTLATLDHPGSC